MGSIDVHMIKTCVSMPFSSLQAYGWSTATGGWALRFGFC